VSIFLGFSLIAVPILFNWMFASLAKQFEYPDILRQPTTVVLAKFRSGGSRLVNTWWLFAMSALLFGVIAVLLPSHFQLQASKAVVVCVLGALASFTQVLGLIRWPFMVPHLAREAEDADEQTLKVIDVVFQSFNRFLGVAVGEHLGYLFTGLWTASLGGALLALNPSSNSGWYLVFGSLGLVLGLLLVICSLEFVGMNEPKGWAFAGVITPYVYIAWSLWLVAMGASILLGTLAK
jgi:hypothetical protein